MPAPRSTPAPITRCRTSVVAAGRIRLGTIFGADRDDIAPSRRFYAGGGGSVRGYGYQRLGPRDVDGDPIGGRSLAEFALEARIRLKAFGGNFGIVPFFDGGTLSTESMPDFERLAVRRRHRRALLFQLRADPDRRRHAAQPAVGRQPGRGRRLARPGLLMAEIGDQRRGERRPAAAVRPHWSRRLVGELAALAGRAADPARASGWCCSTPRRGTAGWSTASARSRPRRACRIRIGRIEGSIFGESRLRNVQVLDPQGRVPDLAVDHARLVAGAPG